jgi:hypothetical protein
MKHAKPIWGFCNAGCEKTWPKGQPIGGIPADIHVKLFKVCDDASVFPDAASLAEHAQSAMQRELDSLYSAIDASTAKKYI